ncbi:peptide MFS transporter [Sphingobium sp.]|uniref:peptide MFS transporter n=1 Tax=Sphingobium sp. TaxID=1912891 RepID=UPI0028BE4E22|nr:peptide MFS transporter [Sphingobium sp.]
MATTTTSQTNILGHPRGLVVLAGTELWDRISFSGMQAILVLYMVEQLFAPGHPANVAGFAWVKAAIEGVFDDLTTQGLATQIFGLYVGFSYLTPLFGGLVGDRWLGRRRAVMLGALLMTAGHFCMAFEASFLLALALIILGAGFLRGNLAPQVAELYAPEDSRRATAFQVYASMVAIGAFVSPLITGWLSQAYDWHVAFTFAGFGMLAGLIWYAAGQSFLPPGDVVVAQSASEPLTKREWRALLALASLVPFCTLFWVAQAQIWNSYNLWVRDHVDLAVGGWTVPVPWLQAFDGLSPLLALPLLLLWWKRREQAGVRSDEIVRMAIGCFIFAAGVLLLAASDRVVNDQGKVLLIMPIAFHLISNVGWLYFSPNANSLFTGAAPRGTRGTMVGIYTLSYFFGSVISGRLGSLYEHWPPADFWLLHAALVGAAGVALMGVASWVHRMTRRATSDGPVGSELAGPLPEPIA